VGRPSIFICYRRTDSGWAGRLQRELTERFGADAVFRDSTIPAGEEWQTHIDKALDGCRVMLVMIGPGWAEDGGRNSRLWDPEDVVRREIQRALVRGDVQVIPVLFDGAAMPARNDLPAPLHRLLERQAINLSDLRWDYDTGELGERIATTVHQIVPRPASDTDRVPTYVALAMIIAAALAAYVASWLAPGTHWRIPSHADIGTAVWISHEVGHVTRIALHTGALWALVGAVTHAALFLTLRQLRRGAVVGVLMGLGSGAIAAVAGALVYVLLKDAVEWDASAPVLNAAAVAASGVVLAGSVAPLLGDINPSIYTSVALVGGLIAGALGGIVLDTQVAHALAWAWVVQAVVLVGCLASLVTVPSLEPRASPAAVEI
jgi:hypothetical protein